jgi:hypothetical protein
MASLVSLHGRGGGRVPTPTGTIDLTRSELTCVVRDLAAELYPHVGYGAALLHLSRREDAARLIAERAASYVAAPAAAPAPPSPTPVRRRVRRQPRRN